MFRRPHALVIASSLLALLIGDSASCQGDDAKPDSSKEASDELPEGYVQSREFVRKHLIGRVVEIELKSKIDHDVYGESETTFRRREMFINFFERNDKASPGFRFDSVSVIEQIVWPLGADGSRTGEKKEKGRVFVVRRTLLPSREQNAAIGQSRFVTHSSGERMSLNPRLKLTVDGTAMVMVSDTSPYDSPVVDGESYSKAFRITDRYEVVNGELALQMMEEDYRVDLKTKARVRGNHTVKTTGREVSGLMAPSPTKQSR